MGAGELKLRGGATKTLEGRFEYNIEGGKPLVKSSINGSHATITIREPEHLRLGGHQRYLWDLQLNDRQLLDLALNCGAGQAKFDLGSLQLRHVEVHMGAGQVDLDLRGTPSRDYDVKISGGVGQANVKLPAGRRYMGGSARRDREHYRNGLRSAATTGKTIYTTRQK